MTAPGTRHERPRSDALVFFGATGDLAYKKIFPALQTHGAARPPRLSRRRRRQVGLDARAARRARAGEPARSTAASTRLRSRRSSSASATSTATTPTPTPSRGCAASSAARAARPTTWPSRRACSRRSSSSCGNRACGEGARVVVEKPFGRDLASARELNEILHRVFPEESHLPHRPLPRQGGGAEHPLLPLRQRVPRADLEPQLRRERADHDGRELRRQGARQVLRGDRRHPRRHPEPPAADRQLPRDGGAVGHVRRGDPRRAGEGAAQRAPARRPKMVRGQFRGYRDEPGVSPDSYMATYAALRLYVDSWRWEGVPFFVRAGKCWPRRSPR